MYSYLKYIVYDKLLKPWQSFRITLYTMFSKSTFEIITTVIPRPLPNPIRAHGS